MSSLIDDVKKLKDQPSSSTRAVIASRIADCYIENTFDAKELPMANEVLQLLAQDTEKLVRKTLARNLRSAINIPKSVALSLAKDIETEVAIPILECSVLLDDEDLVDIIDNANDSSKLQAIARREDVSETVSDSLVKTNQPDIMETLVNNSGATLSTEAAEKIIAIHNTNPPVMDVLSEKGGLPIHVVEKLISKVSASMQDKLIKEYNIRKNVAQELLQDSYEDITIETVKSTYGDKLDIQTLVARLHKENKLTHSMIIRALCQGEIKFFEVSLALIANIGVTKTSSLLWDNGGIGFPQLYKRAKLPEEAFKAINMFLVFVRKDKEAKILGDGNFANRMLERINASGYDHQDQYMEYMKSIIVKELQQNNTPAIQ